jgi:hypothetical protein
MTTLDGLGTFERPIGCNRNRTTGFAHALMAKKRMIAILGELRTPILLALPRASDSKDNERNQCESLSNTVGHNDSTVQTNIPLPKKMIRS